MLISLVLAVAGAILAAYFASNNLTPMQIDLLGQRVQGTTGVLMVTALGIGVVIGILIMLPALVSRSWDLIRNRRKLQDCQDRQAREYADEEVEEE